MGPDSSLLDGYAYTEARRSCHVSACFQPHRREVFPRVVARLGQEYRLTQTCYRNLALSCTHCTPHIFDIRVQTHSRWWAACNSHGIHRAELRRHERSLARWTLWRWGSTLANARLCEAKTAVICYVHLYELHDTRFRNRLHACTTPKFCRYLGGSLAARDPQCQDWLTCSIGWAEGPSSLISSRWRWNSEPRQGH